MQIKKELKIITYESLGELPNPFLFNDGTIVANYKDWERRRKEIYQTAVELQFGTLPPNPEVFEVEQLNCGKQHRSYKIYAGTKTKQVSFVIKVIIPKGISRPVIIDGDMCAGYYMNESFIKAATDKDIGWILFDRTELAHDIIGEGRGCGALYKVYPEYSFGTIGAWAWGYSRCIDAIERIGSSQIDLSCIAVTGHSRGGKAAMLSGAIDERIAIVNPNEACLGGGGCYRFKFTGDYPDLMPWHSETLKDICKDTGFWLGTEMMQYIDHESELPFDTHYLKAMVAPRVLFVSEAAGDVWANPVGSWMTSEAAREVYKFFGVENNLIWYFRDGTHYHKVEDVNKLVKIICHKHDGEELGNDFYILPFKPPINMYSWKAPTNYERE